MITIREYRPAFVDADSPPEVIKVRTTEELRGVDIIRKRMQCGGFPGRAFSIDGDCLMVTVEGEPYPWVAAIILEGKEEINLEVLNEANG